MAVYFIVHATINDADKMKEYDAGAGSTVKDRGVKDHGGEVVSRGPYRVLAGESAGNMMVVLKFPSKAAAQGWYDSPAYQAVIPTRLQAMDATFTLVGE
ncbi:MAG: DUF1330 domain-containing protein [Gammaproteobacteria bacterium]|nr:DUF1330 domain-containing protein [Gammaproteobacteria bacterium]